MMTSRSTLIIALIAVLSGVFIAYIALVTTTDNVKATTDQPEPYVKIGRWTCPDTMLVTVTKEPLPPVKVPTYIPDGYRPIDCHYYMGNYLVMYFLHESIDPKDENVTADMIKLHTIKFDATWFYEEHIKAGGGDFDGMKSLEEERDTFVNKDTIQLFYINGNPAMGWESGMKKSVVILDDKVIDSTEISYAAVVTMYDEKALVSYSVVGYLPLDELKKILESLEEP